MTPSSQAGGTRAPTRGVTCPAAPGGFEERSGEAGLPRFLLGGSIAGRLYRPAGPQPPSSLLPQSLSRETSEQTADSMAGMLASELAGAWPCPSPAGDLQEVIYSPCL